MNAVLVWLGWAALAAAALFALLAAQAMLRMRRLLWRVPRMRTAAREDIPADVRAVLDMAVPLLAGWGFIYRYSVAQRPMVVLGDDADAWGDVYASADGRTHAMVTRAMAPQSLQPFVLDLLSGLEDGSNLHTLNAREHELPPPLPGWFRQDPYLADLNAVWALHQQRVQAAKVDVVTDGLVMRSRLQGAPAQWAKSLAQQSWLVSAPTPGRWRMAWRAVWQMFWRVQRGQMRVAKLKQDSAGLAPTTAAPPASTASPLQADLAAWKQHQAVQQATRANAQSKWRNFGISALLFGALGTWLFSWDFMLILLAVIGLHEGGHLLAMRLTGHRNVSVLFVPGLGGVAMGEKRDATPLQKLSVYLAGPMPGLLLAVVALVGLLGGVFDPPDWFNSFLMACFVVNYLNLLPVTPLDGGRVMETFLFARWPRWRFAFALLCCALLLAAGWAMGDMVLKVLGVLVALSLPQQWRVMQVDRSLPPQGGMALDEPQALERLFGAMHAAPFNEWAWPRRLAVAQTLLPELMGRRPRWGESVAGLAIYAACLLMPLAALALAVPQLMPVAGAWWSLKRTPPDAVVEDVAAPRFHVGMDAETNADAPGLDADQRLQAELRALERAVDLQEPAERTLRRDAVRQLAEARPAGDGWRARAWLALAHAAEDDAEARGLMERIVQELPAPTDDRRLLLAEAKQWMAQQHGSDPVMRTSWLGEAVALRTAQGPAFDVELLRLREEWARRLDAQGDAAGARAALEASLAALPAEPGPARTRSALQRATGRAEAETALAWFLIDHGQAAQALALATQGLTALPAPPTRSWLMPAKNLHEAALWAALLSPQPERVAALWKAFDRAYQDSSAYLSTNLQHTATRAVVAQALGDARMARQAQGDAAALLKKNPRLGAMRVCKPMAASSEWRDWHQRAHTMRAEALRRLGVCSVTP